MFRAFSRQKTLTGPAAPAHPEVDAGVEEKLRAQNSRLDAALNNMTQGVCMFDADTRVVVYNRRFLEMYSLSPQVMTAGCTLHDVIRHRVEVGLLDADVDQYCQKILDNVARGTPSTHYNTTTDGRVMRAHNQPMPGGGWVTTHEDITEQRRAEERIREQRLQLDTALNNMTQGLLMFDARARLILCNQRYLQMYDLPAEAVQPGCALQDLLRLRRAKGTFPHDPDYYVSELQAELAKGQPVIFAAQLQDGRFINVANHPMPGGGWVVTHEDITEQRRAEQRLREQKLHLDAGVENISQGLAMFDADARMILCNRRYMAIYGLTPETVKPGMSLSEVLQARHERSQFSGDAEAHSRMVQATTAKGQTFQTIAELPDGRVVSVQNQPMPGGGWVSTHEDITERRHAERQLHEQKLQLDTALNNMSQGLNMFDAAGRLMVFNERYLQMYRLPAGAVQPGCTVHELVKARIAAGTFFSTDPEQYATDLLAAMSNREPTAATMELTDGRIIHVISQPTPAGGGWVVTHEDVTERKKAERERDRSQAFASTVIEYVPATIAVKDAKDLRYVLINRAGEDYFGVPRNQMIGKTAHELFPQDTADKIAQNDATLLRTGETMFNDEHPVTVPSGATRIVATTRMPIRDSNGRPQYLLTVVEDRTRRKRAEAQLAHLAHHDVLTGSPNRTAFNECLAATLEDSREHNNSFALFCLDLDRLKEINDVFGQLTGDKLLCEVARRLQATVGGAFVARLGGDEFAVIATDGDFPAAAEAMAKKIVAALSDDFVIDGQQLRTSMSAGIAIYPVDGADAETLVANADAALSRGKSDGRGTFRFFEPDMDRRLREQRALQQDLKSAIERRELTLHYQPQARIGGEIIGFEALVRWHHPSRGTITPGTFIPLAEESGLIVPMGEWIMREACRQAAAWQKPLTIAINLSPVQFRDGNLAELVHSVLLETGLAPSRLELEITEGVLIGDFSRALSILRRLKALGVRIAMDDFGTGYSSLSYLQAFPFDKIKIDQAFISNLEQSPQSVTIIRAVIGLARGLKVPVLAEGVETEDQLAFLAQETCDEIQGYLIGAPKPIEEYAALTGAPVAPASEKPRKAAG